MPKLILPLALISLWASAIVVISDKVHYLGVNSVLLTLTGFVVSLSLSFRSATAYERYAEGRKYWAALSHASQTLGRVFWIHAEPAPGQADIRELLLQKLGAMNLLVAYAVALKHSLRFEPYAAYPDLQHLIGHLDTFAKAAAGASSAASASTSASPLPPATRARSSRGPRGRWETCRSRSSTTSPSPPTPSWPTTSSACPSTRRRPSTPSRPSTTS